jgi:chemotaxis protein methyltransferase CheR
MTGRLGPEDVERFRSLVSRRLGLYFDDDKLEQLADVMRERLESRGGDPGAYLAQLTLHGTEEVRALAKRLTVGETYFFRYMDHFRAFAEVVLPERVRLREGRRQLRILSAGCASGEEAYSLAILVREHLPGFDAWDVRIDGIDVNPSAVERAAAARYSAWSLRETPASLRERYFLSHGRDYLLDAAVRSSVSFEERNLVDHGGSFWEPGAFDVVFCRNVIMYFTPDVMRAVVARITRSLAPDGFLFLGHAETLRGVSQEHRLCHTHETFYYQRRDGEGPSAVELQPEDGPKAGPVPASMSVAIGLEDSSWVDVIQRASDRIAKLSHDARSASSEVRAPAAPRAQWDLLPAVEMLRQERFVEAMDLLQALPAESRTDSDAQLLRAVLLTNSGRLLEAEVVCQQILSKDELHAGAHYLAALCREHAGDRPAAREHDRIASYLDASFAMPHLHLGLIARRTGAPEQARVELERALALLAREDASRILLYGGGFSREALVELCRAELRTRGVAP